MIKGKNKFDEKNNIQKAVSHAARSAKLFQEKHADPKHIHRRAAMKNWEELKTQRTNLNRVTLD